MSSAAVLCDGVAGGADGEHTDGKAASINQCARHLARSGVEEFNILFADPARQRPQICLALQQLVVRVSKRVTFPSKQRREELIGDVYLDCVARINQFNPARRNPYLWFALVARRRFWARIRGERFRRVWSLDDIDTDTAQLRPLHQAAPHRAAEPPPLTCGKTRDRMAEYLDELLRRALKANRHSTTESQQITRGMVLALQQVRRRLVGTYQPMQEGDLMYTRRRKVEAADDGDGIS